jgi:tRNA threonylcarbamoyladenosine biosynthesis protein TsaE
VEAPVSSRIALTTTSAEDTKATTAAVASLLRAGDVVALSGELGTGKTCFVQGAADGLGVTMTVTSPTFVLVKLLPAPVPVVHVDVYRLERLVHLDDLGEDVFAPDVVTFVEWADTIRPLLPEDRLDVVLAPGEDPAAPHVRRLTLCAQGARWAPRFEALEQVCQPWA